MDERNIVNDQEKLDEIMLPGFRFHPTDEELVGFYLKRKIQQRPLSIELITQLDIYKYDPWDLPKLATTGEKEWYFYCPRDRKYRNSARPNRVTGAGFWKATGTDRPIYSSEGSKCIGLKKSLVFYKGRAAKGVKTDWMMHEFRLPSLIDQSSPSKFMDKNLAVNDSWAICRIFKKTNSSAQRALSHSWVSPLPETNKSHVLTRDHIDTGNAQFCPESMPTLTKKACSLFQFYGSNNNYIQQSFSNGSPPLDATSYKPVINSLIYKPIDQTPISNAGDFTTGFLFPSSFETPTSSNSRSTMDVSSLLLNMSCSVLGDFGKTSSSESDFGRSHEQCSNCFPSSLQMHEIPGSIDNNGDGDSALIKNIPIIDVHHTDDQLEMVRSSNGFPLYWPSNVGDAWKSNLIWEASPCPTEMSSSSYSVTKCYT